VKQSKKLSDVMGDISWPADEERSFGQQMNDIGVEVVKPSIKWYKPDLRRGGKLGDRISITKSCITLGQKVAEKINADNKIAVGIVENRGRTTLALRIDDKKGMKITKTKKQSYRLGTKRLIKWLLEQGIEIGVYELKKTKDGSGWIASKM